MGEQALTPPRIAAGRLDFDHTSAEIGQEPTTHPPPFDGEVDDREVRESRQGQSPPDVRVHSEWNRSRRAASPHSSARTVDYTSPRQTVPTSSSASTPSPPGDRRWPSPRAL